MLSPAFLICFLGLFSAAYLLSEWIIFGDDDDE